MDLILTHEGSRTKCSARTATKLTVVARNVSGWPVCMIFHVSISDPSPWSLKIPTYIWVIAIAPKMMVGDWSLLLAGGSRNTSKSFCRIGAVHEDVVDIHRAYGCKQLSMKGQQGLLPLTKCLSPPFQALKFGCANKPGK